jgi:hypothetical protein
MAFVSTLPRWFAPFMTTLQAEGLSAESFDESLPRHPPKADLALYCLSYSNNKIGLSFKLNVLILLF